MIVKEGLRTGFYISKIAHLMRFYVIAISHIVNVKHSKKLHFLERYLLQFFAALVVSYWLNG